MRSITPDGKPDNFLLEMELALEAYGKGRMAIYPLLVGSDADGIFTQFRVSALKLDSFPDHRSPTSQHSVKATLNQIFRFQGVRLSSSIPSDDMIDGIAKWTDDFAWNKTSPASLRVCAALMMILRSYMCVV
jgi:hypothetical protein